MFNKSSIKGKWQQITTAEMPRRPPDAQAVGDGDVPPQDGQVSLPVGRGVPGWAPPTAPSTWSSGRGSFSGGVAGVVSVAAAFQAAQRRPTEHLDTGAAWSASCFHADVAAITRKIKRSSS